MVLGINQMRYGAANTVYYPSKFSGTADCIGIYENKESLMIREMLISLRRMSGQMIIGPKYGLCNGTQHCLWNPYFSRCNSVVHKDNIFQRFIIDGERFKKYQNQFMEKVEQYYSQRMAN